MKRLRRSTSEEIIADSLTTCSLGWDSQAVVHTTRKWYIASYKTRSCCWQCSAEGRGGGTFRNPCFSTLMTEIPRSSKAEIGIIIPNYHTGVTGKSSLFRKSICLVFST